MKLLYKYRGTCRDALKQIDNIDIAHADTTMGQRLSHWFTIRRTVNVYIALHCINAGQPIATYFTARQPKNAGQNPVPLRIAPGQIGRIDLPRIPAPDKDSIQRLPSPYFGANQMLSPGSATTIFLLAGSIESR